MSADIHYARSGGVAIAYKVVGEGDVDLVYVPDYVSNLVYDWEYPRRREFYERLARSFRLILFDKRGTGLSDHGGQFANLETRMEDLRAVLDTVGSSSPVIFAAHEGAGIASLFAATYPERVRALVLFHVVWGGGTDDVQVLRELRELRDRWGTQEYSDSLLEMGSPSLAANEEDRRWFANSLRVGAATVPDSVLAAVMFTDIVSSTARATALGDRAWRDLLTKHHALVRRELGRYRGKERDTAGDGFFATFDGPARAIRAAEAIVGGVNELGLEARIGIHVGECELHEDKVAGLAVNIGARVAGHAGANEILVSQTVRDLVAGSGIDFVDRGTHELKGIPGTWQLFAVSSAGARRDTLN